MIAGSSRPERAPVSPRHGSTSQYENHTQQEGSPQVEMLWNCSSENKLGQTPLPWVFGDKPTCIEAAVGGSGTVYRRC
jgi:hypothetical protein